MESELTLRVASAIDTGKELTINDYRELDMGRVKIPTKEVADVDKTKETDGMIV